MIRGAVVVPTNKPMTTPWPSSAPVPDAPPPGPSEGWQLSNPPGLPPEGPPDAASVAPATPEGSGWVTPELAAKVPIWRRAISWAFLGFIVLGAIAGFIFNAGRAPTGEIERAGDMVAAELRVGDCFDFKDPDEEVIEDVTARPCAEAHEYEVVWIGFLPEGSYPTEAAIYAWAEEHCVAGFNEYVGRDFESSVLDLSWIYPDEEAWNSDRSVQCTTSHPDKPRLTGSLKGSKL
jgi:putative regulator of septum formation